MLSAQNPTAEFSGGPFVDFNDGWQTIQQEDPGGPVGPDYTLFHVQSDGQMTVHTSSAASPGSDIDLTIYRSSEAGEKGARLTPPNSFQEGPEETQSVRTKVGWYLLRATGYPAAGATYVAKATLAFPPAPAPVVTVPAVPAPPTADTPKPAAKKKKLSCRAKAKRIKSAKKRKAALRRCARAQRRR